jgi:hypothetical protein
MFAVSVWNGALGCCVGVTVSSVATTSVACVEYISNLANLVETRKPAPKKRTADRRLQDRRINLRQEEKYVATARHNAL